MDSKWNEDMQSVVLKAFEDTHGINMEGAKLRALSSVGYMEFFSDTCDANELVNSMINLTSAFAELKDYRRVQGGSVYNVQKTEIQMLKAFTNVITKTIESGSCRK